MRYLCWVAVCGVSVVLKLFLTGSLQSHFVTGHGEKTTHGDAARVWRQADINNTHSTARVKNLTGAGLASLAMPDHQLLQHADTWENCSFGVHEILVWPIPSEEPEAFLLRFDIWSSHGVWSLSQCSSGVRVCRSLERFPCSCNGSGMALWPVCDKSVCSWLWEKPEVFGCLEDLNFGVIRCPVTWGDQSVRNACEKGQGRHTRDEPVTDITTQVTYRNRDCATCNNASALTPWHIAPVCSHVQNLYAVTSPKELLQKASKLPQVCSLKHVQPDKVKVSPCPANKEWFFDVINCCNVTRRWAVYDPEIEKGCLGSRSAWHRAMENESGTVFQNALCAMCNGVVPEKHGVCHNLTCTAGKLLDAENSTCVTAVTEIRGLVYKLHISLLPETGLALNTSTNEALKKLVREIESKLTEKTQHYVFEYNLTITLDIVCNEHEGEITQIMIKGDIIASRDLNRDVAEGFLVHNLVIDSWTLGESVSKEKFTLSQKVDLAELNNMTVSSGRTNVTVYSVNDPQWADKVVRDLRTTGFRTVEIVNALKNVSSTSPSNSIPESLKIPMTPLLTCAYVRLAKDEYEFRESEDGTHRLFLVSGYNEAEVKTFLHTRMEEDDMLSVCVETLNSLAYVYKSNPAPLWQHVLSWVAISLSIVCVFLTLVVYALLPALRTQPGLNVMGTCGALLVAQVALLLASSKVVADFWCQALGVIVHEAWLSSFCWMTICSMHMFHVFSAKTRHVSNSLFWKTSRNIVISLTLPALVVAIVVAVSYVQSHGGSIGYSSDTCFLSSQVLLGTAMVLPLSLMVVVNFVLFILTVRRIHEVTQLKPRADSKHDSHQHVLVCTRLSLLTGITWTLSLLAEGLELDWLRGLSIVANGGQGVLLFLSYVTTRRVCLLLGARFGGNRDVTSTTRSTNDKFSSNPVST